MAEIIALFLEDAPKQIEAAAGAVRGGNAAEIRQHALSLKSASANMAAEELRQAACDLEEAAVAGRLGDDDKCLSTIRARFETLREVLGGA